VTASWLRRLVAFSHRRHPGSIHGQSMWDMCWIKWQWNRFSPSTSPPPCHIIPQTFHIHPFVCHRRDMISVNDIVLKHTKQKTSECKVFPVGAMKTWGMEAWHPTFLTSTVVLKCDLNRACPVTKSALTWHLVARKCCLLLRRSNGFVFLYY
jgi:hypothetical protein